MSVNAVIRADALPTKVSGSRAPLWWGMVFLLVVEATVFATLVTSYFYLRSRATEWPPAGIAPPALLLPTINAVILLVSSGAIYWADSGIRQGDQRRLKLGLAVGFVLGVLFLTLKAVEYSDQSYDWTTNAYGSIVWTITGFHSAHVVGLLGKTIAVGVLAWQGYFTRERHLGVQINGLYWHFVVAAWVPLYAVLYLSPRLL